MRVNIFLSCLVYLALAIGASAQGINDLTGTWRTVRHGALVTITDCGNGSPCGGLEQVSTAITNGHTTDIRNPNATLRTRPLIGVPILWGFASGTEGWRNGHLYNPDDGKTFRAYLRLLSPNELRVTGCLGPFCRSQIWTRISNP